MIKFFIDYLPFGNDTELLYYSLYGSRCGTFSLHKTILNKSLLRDFEKKYKIQYLRYYLNSAFDSDVSIADYQQMQFLIMLKPKLFVEYDSVKYYHIYYDLTFEDNELQEVLNIFRKNQKTDWIKSLRYISPN
jgi:hypothetical protein